MDFDLPGLLAAHRDDGYELYGRYLNPQQPKVLHMIGFDKVYERAEGAYLYDADGYQYADFLSGFGVFAAGRNHPVIRRALHDALDAQLADWTQFDCDPAFHGLTTGSLSINGSAEFRRGFEPLLPDTSIPLGDLDALAAELRKGDIAARASRSPRGIRS